jgi:hypothetical protein
MNSACQQKRVRIANLISLSKPFKFLILTITSRYAVLCILVLYITYCEVFKTIKIYVPYDEKHNTSKIVAKRTLKKVDLNDICIS